MIAIRTAVEIENRVTETVDGTVDTDRSDSVNNVPSHSNINHHFVQLKIKNNFKKKCYISLKKGIRVFEKGSLLLGKLVLCNLIKSWISID